MFVSAKVYQAALQELTAERARREQLDGERLQRAAMVGFLCARVNQLETERALLLRHVLKDQVTFPVPTLTATMPLTVPDAGMVAEAFGAPPDIFADMGDEAAKRAGIGWDRDGRVQPVGVER